MSVTVIHRDDRSTPFFDATARQTLLLPRCRKCDAFSTPGVSACSACGDADLEWTKSSGRGEAVTWTTTFQTGEGTGDVSCTTILVVQAEEGPWLTMQARGIDPEALYIGFPVRVAFEQPAGGECVPVAEPR